MTAQRAPVPLGKWIAPPRFIAFTALLPAGIAAWHWIDPAASWQDALTMGFDLAAAVFLLSLLPLLRRFSADEMRGHASDNDANRAVTLGMTFQTSDVVITAPRVRHLALLHSLVAFAFNIGVIAFTINALG